MGEKRKTYSILVGNPERKISLGRPRRKLLDIKNAFKRERIGWCGLDLFGLE
jgi:hypothetical protein